MSRRGNFSQRRFRRRFPLKCRSWKRIRIRCLRDKRQGEGMARIQGLVTFIPNTKPGDHVKIKITRVAEDLQKLK